MHWIIDLSPANFSAFLEELPEAVREAMAAGDRDELVMFFEGWEATAELDAAPEVVAEIRRRKEYRRLESFQP